MHLHCLGMVQNRLHEATGGWEGAQHYFSAHLAIQSLDTVISGVQQACFAESTLAGPCMQAESPGRSAARAARAQRQMQAAR